MIYFLILVSGINIGYSQCDATFSTNPINLEICDNQSIQFTLTSNSVITQRTWTFGDGTSPSGTSNPSHIFNSSKDTIYKVSLIIRCSNGLRDTGTVNVKVFARPKADFSTSKASMCAISDSVCLTNLSSNPSGVTYLWDFGDLNVSTDFSTCHTYFTSGDFDVELRAIRPSNQGGCQQKAVKSISVKESPNPDFVMDPANGCLPFQTTISNYTASQSTISDWQWDFGDGTSFTGINPGTKDYTVAGTYNVKLSISNVTGCKNFTTLPIFVSNAPTLSLSSPPNVCPNIPITITAITNASNAFYNWNTSGGQIISGSSSNAIVVKWATGGIKNISIDINQNGCVVSDATTGFVFPETNLRAVYPKGNKTCMGDSIQVQVLPPLIPNYTFYKGNTTILNTSVSGITFYNLQTDTALSVRITDENNCTFSANISGEVKPYPILTVTSSPSSTFCPATNATISVLPTGLNDYSFYLNFGLVQSGTGFNFASSSFQKNDRIQVIGNLNGCKDTSSIIKITLIDSLAIEPPIVNCGKSDLSSVEFVWNSVPGVAFYQVSTDDGPYLDASTGLTGLKHKVSGLSQGQNVTIKIMAVRTLPCPDTSYSEVLTCTAINCDGLSFSLLYDTVFCSEETIVLTATGIKGITPDYQFTWNDVVTKDSIFSISAKSLLTIPGNDMNVFLNDTTFKPCPGFKQVTYGIDIIDVPLLTLDTTRRLNYCTQKDTIIIQSFPSNLDKYEYILDNVFLSKDTIPWLSIPVNDSKIHTLNARAKSNSCTGKYSVFTFKGINFPNYEAIINFGDSVDFATPTSAGGAKNVCSSGGSGGGGVSGQVLTLDMKTKAYIKVISGVDTTFIATDSAYFFKVGVRDPFYRGAKNATVYNGPAENSSFYSKVLYKGCLIPSFNKLDVIVKISPPPVVVFPKDTTLRVKGSLDTSKSLLGLVEQTCNYNKFYYKIFPRIAGTVWEVKTTPNILNQTTNIFKDSDFSFYATVPTLDKSGEGGEDLNTGIYKLAKAEYENNKAIYYTSYLAKYKQVYATISGISNSELESRIVKSADSLLNNQVLQYFAGIANDYLSNELIINLKSNNGCASSNVKLYPRQGINFHSVIEGDELSCNTSNELKLPFVSLVLTKPNDTITISVDTYFTKNKPLHKIVGTYVQTFDTAKASVSYPTPPLYTSNVFLQNYQNFSDSIKVLPTFSFNGYYPAIHTIKISNSKGCHLDYIYKTDAKSPTKPISNPIIQNVCVSDVIQGAVIEDSANSIYNFWTHPFISKDIKSNKYIFQPTIPIDKFQTFMISCETPDSTGSCCVYNTISGCTMDCEEMQFIPNAISPNGDNVNDKWKIYGFRNPRVDIFNRWGELIYHSDQYMNDWDGKAPNGVPFPDGVYVYIVYPQGEYTMNNQTTHHIASIDPDEYIRQNQNPESNSESAQTNVSDPVNLVTRQLPNYDQIPDLKYLDPKTKASYYFCKKISFNELRGTLIIQR